jgi:hypothetical protein
MVVALTVVTKPIKQAAAGLDAGATALLPSLYRHNLYSFQIPIKADAGLEALVARLNASKALRAVGGWFHRVADTVPFLGDDSYLLELARSKPLLAGLELRGPVSEVVATVYHNTTVIHALPIVLELLLDALAAANATNVSVTSQPLPFSQSVQWDPSVFYTVLLIGQCAGPLAGRLNRVSPRGWRRGRHWPQRDSRRLCRGRGQGPCVPNEGEQGRAPAPFFWGGGGVRLTITT